MDRNDENSGIFAAQPADKSQNPFWLTYRRLPDGRYVISSNDSVR